MLYHVRAQPILGKTTELWRVLTDGTVADQEPDGQEIIASMKRAVISQGIVEWHETCYCSPPLKHEKATVYDRFFTAMKAERVDSTPSLKGEKFWKHLEELQKGRE